MQTQLVSLMIKKFCHDSENNFSKKRRFFQTFRKTKKHISSLLLDIFKRILERQSEGHLTLDVRACAIDSGFTVRVRSRPMAIQKVNSQKNSEKKLGKSTKNIGNCVQNKHSIELTSNSDHSIDSYFGVFLVFRDFVLVGISKNTSQFWSSH